MDKHINRNTRRIQKKIQDVESKKSILEENPNRFVLFPIQHDEVWQMYKKAEASFWTAEEIDLSQDLKDWENLNDGERHFISHVLAFFSATDSNINLIVEHPRFNFRSKNFLSNLWFDSLLRYDLKSLIRERLWQSVAIELTTIIKGLKKTVAFLLSSSYYIAPNNLIGVKFFMIYFHKKVDEELKSIFNLNQLAIMQK